MFQKILWVTDFSESATRALDWAKLFTRTFRGTLTLLHVLPRPESQLPERLKKEMDDHLEKRLEERTRALQTLADRLEGEGLKVQAYVRSGRVVENILEEGSTHDLIVLGIRGETGAKGAFIGTTAYRLIQGVNTPVLAIPDQPRNPVRVEDILVPVDLSPSSLQQIPRAMELAEAFRARVTVLHVIELLETISEEELSRELLQDIWRQLKEHHPDLHPSASFGLRVVRRYDAAPGILDVAQESGVDLLVMGSRGRHGLMKALLGSVTEQVLRATPCPVLVFRV